MKKTLISKLLAFGMTVSMMMGSVQPVMAAEAEDPCANGHILTEWSVDNSQRHYRLCSVCYGEDTLELEDHNMENGICTVCGYVNWEDRNAYLSPFREDALKNIKKAAEAYEIYGDELSMLVGEADYQINFLADDEASIMQIENEMIARIPEAALIDAMTDAHQKVDEAVNSKPRSDEFRACVQGWQEEIDECENIKSVKTVLSEILNEKIPACEEQYGYVDPMSNVYGKIAGTYEQDDNSEIKYMVGMDENQNYQILYDNEGVVSEIDFSDPEIDEKTGEISILSENGRLIFAGDTLTVETTVVVNRRPVLVYTYFTKISGGKPVGEVPVCPECKEAMILVATNEEGCTWECDTAGCPGVLSGKNHVSGEICICKEACIHTFDGAVCTKCSYVSPKLELVFMKESFEAYKNDAVMTADSYASSDDSADVAQLITNAKEAINAVEFDKDSIDTKKAEIDSILSELESAIAAQKEAEKEAVKCVSERTIAPKAGSYELYLNGVSVGIYSFTPVSGGWALGTPNGYLTVENGSVTFTDVPTAWGYKNGAFFRTVETRQSGILGWFGLTKTTTYYLTSATTISTKAVKTEIRETVFASAHTYTKWVDQKNGTHTATCTLCGESETRACQYDDETGYCECGAYNPALVNVTIKATVEKVTQKYLIFFTKTSYRATIKTEAKGTTVKKVEYSTDGGKTWKSGSSFTSGSPIEGFLVCATDANGQVYYYTYPEGSEVVEVIDR
ncbi:MAG: hypothetical protein MJ097_06015 [Dorea sp.]|nr:hypothetical protein [Dorea sp.]